MIAVLPVLVVVVLVVVVVVATIVCEDKRIMHNHQAA